MGIINITDQLAGFRNQEKHLRGLANEETVGPYHQARFLKDANVLAAAIKEMDLYLKVHNLDGSGDYRYVGHDCLVDEKRDGFVKMMGASRHALWKVYDFIF